VCVKAETYLYINKYLLPKLGVLFIKRKKNKKVRIVLESSREILQLKRCVVCFLPGMALEMASEHSGISME
jgi:hypothetical protein